MAGVLLGAAACAPQAVQPAARPVSAPLCPDDRPTIPATAQAKPLVAGSPAAAVVCRYSLPVPAGHIPLIRSTIVSDVIGLVSALNAADTTPPPRGTMCPMDNGATDIVIFAYAKGDPEYITVHPTGCATATNGKTTAYRLSEALLSKL